MPASVTSLDSNAAPAILAGGNEQPTSSVDYAEFRGIASSIKQGRLLDQLHAVGSTVEIRKSREIVTQGDVAETCFEVINGCARSLRRFEDGRCQVGEFLLPGDVFGLDAVGSHAFGAEAVTAVIIRRHPLSSVERLALADAVFGGRLRRHLALQSRTMGNRLVTLGRMTAAERIAGFLLEMTERLNVTATGVIELPMGRGDIADYLGLTIETISRSLNDLKRRGAITVQGPRISIRDRRILATNETLH